MSTVAERVHVTLSGDIAGEYVVEDRQPDGRLILVPDTSVDAIFARHGAKLMTSAKFERHFGDLPTDEEG
ncbi:MAG: hypothetical protein WBQ21_04790 [Solirubrobacteraceae bacterium]